MKIFLGVILVICFFIKLGEGIQFYRNKVELRKRNILITYSSLALFLFNLALDMFIK